MSALRSHLESAIWDAVEHVEIASTPPGWRAAPVDPSAFDRAARLALGFPDIGLLPTLLLRASSLDVLADPTGATRIWLANEGGQRTGSFKVRGALCALDVARNRSCTHVVAASAGNHGAGVAFAAAALGLHATIVVPASAPRTKLDKMRSSAVTLVPVQGGYDVAEQRAKQIAAATSSPFVSPYDDDDVIAGNGGSLAAEIVRTLGSVPSRVIAPMGGGGLAIGLAGGLARSVQGPGEAQRRVWVVQSVASPAFAKSIVTGEVVETLEASEPTLAEGLEGGISCRAAARAARAVLGVSVVSEASIARSMVCLHRQFGLRIEGSGAAAAVPALAGLPAGLRGGDVVIVLTGGNVDDAVFTQVVGSSRRC